MGKLDTDILISGGGIAGRIAACAFGSAGYSVLCVDPQPASGKAIVDLRSTAFWQPARDLLQSAGLWTPLAPHAAPLQMMRIVDAGGAQAETREIVDFDADEISDEPFGWNFPNAELRKATGARIAALAQVTLLQGVAFGSVTTRLDRVIVRLSDGRQVNARLLIGADGRESAVRTAVGIDAKTWRYGQKALVFSVTHPEPHHDVSTEIHRTGGPFTLVPLADHKGLAHSAIVWMETGPRALELAALGVEEFEAAITERSAGMFGPLRLVSGRAVWPIISRLAARLTARRTALIAEAAHVVPPIGAQGLNMSLADIATLLNATGHAPDDPGADRVLATYQSQRWSAIRKRVHGVDLLNRASMAENPLLRDLRRAGLLAIERTGPLKRTLMRAGLGKT